MAQQLGEEKSTQKLKNVSLFHLVMPRRLALLNEHVSCKLTTLITRNVEAVIFQTLPLPHLSLPLPLPHLSLPLSPTKNEKTTVENFFNFCGSVACFLLHFIILKRQKHSFIAITLPTSLELIISNYSVFVFLRYQKSC